MGLIGGIVCHKCLKQEYMGHALNCPNLQIEIQAGDMVVTTGPMFDQPVTQLVKERKPDGTLVMEPPDTTVYVGGPFGPETQKLIPPLADAHPPTEIEAGHCD